MKLRNLILLCFLGLTPEVNSVEVQDTPAPKLLGCMGKTITFKLDGSSSLEDRRAFADSSAWWARYGVLVRFDGVEVGQSLKLVLKDHPWIIMFEKHNPSNILALRIPDSREVLIIKSRVNTSKDMTGILNHEIGHILGMKDVEDDPESLMFHFYEKPARHLSYSDMKQFSKCR